MVRLTGDDAQTGSPAPDKRSRRIRVWRDETARATGPEGAERPGLAGAGLFPDCSGRARLERALRRERRESLRGGDYSPARHLALARLARRMSG